MLLVTLTINAATRRVSNEEISTLTNPWYAEIVSAPKISRSVEKEHGGIVKMRWGDMSFLPTTFKETTWPPPMSVDMTVQWTATTEAAAITLLTAKLHLKQISRDKITYAVYQEQVDDTVENEAFTGTLTSEFNDAASDLSLSYDGSDARATSPDVDYNGSGQLIDLLSKMAAYFTHFCWVDSGTLYLADMLASLSTHTMTEFDHEPIVYSENAPYNRIEDGEFGVEGSYPYGGVLNVSPKCEVTEAPALVALGDIKTIVEMPRVTISCPITATNLVYIIGDRINFTNSIQDISGWVRVRSIQYDFDRRFITFSGDGYIE